MKNKPKFMTSKNHDKPKEPLKYQPPMMQKFQTLKRYHFTVIRFITHTQQPLPYT